MLCEKCRPALSSGVRVEKGQRLTVTHHTTIESLISATDSGCYICEAAIAVARGDDWRLAELFTRSTKFLTFNLIAGHVTLHIGVPRSTLSSAYRCLCYRPCVGFKLESIVYRFYFSLSVGRTGFETVQGASLDVISPGKVRLHIIHTLA